MNKKLLLLAVPITLVFGGCQSYTKPPMAIKHSTFTDIPEEEKILFPEEMKLLTLEKAQEIALKNNPDFLRVKFTIDSARARYYQSFSSYAPTLNAGLSFSQSFGKVTSSSNGEKPTMPCFLLISLISSDAISIVQNLRLQTYKKF